MLRRIAVTVLVGAGLLSCGKPRVGGRYSVTLDDAAGLAAGAPVYVHGVRVGTVQLARLDGERARVEFDIEVGSGATLKRDACASTGWYSGSLAPHLKIELGTAAAPPLGSTGEVTCVRTSAMSAQAEKTMAQVATLVTSVAEGKGTIGRLLKDEELAQRIADYFAKGAPPAAAPAPTPAVGVPATPPTAPAPTVKPTPGKRPPDLADPFTGRQ